MKLSLELVWSALYVGLFYDEDAKCVYFCLIPCVVICLHFMGYILDKGWREGRITGWKFEYEFDTTVHNIFSILTFLYYLILVSVIVWWAR